MHISAKIITRELLEEEQMLLNVYLTKRDLQYFVTYQKPILDGVMQPAFIEVSCDGDDSEMLTEQLREFVRAAEKAWGAAPCTAIYQYMDSSAYGDSGVYWIGSPEACLKNWTRQPNSRSPRSTPAARWSLSRSGMLARRISWSPRCSDQPTARFRLRARRFLRKPNVQRPQCGLYWQNRKETIHDSALGPPVARHRLDRHAVYRQHRLRRPMGL